MRNPYSKECKELAKKLEQYGAEIKYYEKAFIEAERPTGVEVACVKVIIPEAVGSGEMGKDYLKPIINIHTYLTYYLY